MKNFLIGLSAFVLVALLGWLHVSSIDGGNGSAGALNALFDAFMLLPLLVTWGLAASGAGLMAGGFRNKKAKAAAKTFLALTILGALAHALLLFFGHSEEEAIHPVLPMAVSILFSLLPLLMRDFSSVKSSSGK